MAHDFFSNFAINEECEFYPRFKDAQEMGIDASDKLDGRIVAVRFTGPKVFYDILSPYWGHLFRDVPAGNVFGAITPEQQQFEREMAK